MTKDVYADIAFKIIFPNPLETFTQCVAQD